MISINGRPIEINKFPDGTLLIKEEPSYDIAIISWFFENNEELVALIYLANHLRANGVKKIQLYMPYVPNARQGDAPRRGLYANLSIVTPRIMQNITAASTAISG